MKQSKQEDIQTPEKKPLSAKYMRSFAFTTMKERVPIMLTKTLDNLVKDEGNIVSNYGEKAQEELKKVIEYILGLKYEIFNDKPFITLSSSGEDAKLWNEYLQNITKENGYTPTYFLTDWMYAECYVYRRLQEAFLITEHLKHYDIFALNKTEALEESIDAIRPLLLHMNEVISSNLLNSKDAITNEFFRLIKLALWGNKCDLALSCGGSVSIRDNSFSLLEGLNSFILVDQTQAIWNALDDCKGETIDVILDNAGYELVTDLCLTEFLIIKCGVKKVRFRAKKMPWFVSDVMEKDFQYIITTLIEKGEPFSETANRWLNYVEQGKFEIISDVFWTLPISYNYMERIDQKLFNDLKTSKLLIFKGDLNYRKLVGDIHWPPTYPFKEALRGFYPSPLTSLRTIKAESVCGLRPGSTKEAEAVSTKWQITGDFALIQFHKQ